MTRESALKKAARAYMAEHGVNYTKALSRVKHLKVGDRVRVTMEGKARFEGEVTFVSAFAFDVKRYDDNTESAYCREELEFISRDKHVPHPPGTKKQNVR
jgi:hypothetical protein